MRSRTDATKVRELIRALGEAVTGPGTIYLIGGAKVDAFLAEVADA